MAKEPRISPRPRRKRLLSDNMLSILFAIALSLAIGCGLLLVISEEPWEAIRSLFLLPFGSKYQVGNIFSKAAPLIFLGLSASVTFQAGYFNMGAQGQFYVGAFCAALTGVYVKGLPAGVHMILVFLAAMAGGMAYALIAGALKAYLNTSEIIITMMQNYIATNVISGLLSGWLRDPSSPSAVRTEYMPEEILLGDISSGIQINTGILIAFAAAAGIYLYMFRSRTGYDARLVGKNRLFARYGGINIRKMTLISFAISGALAGLGGAVEILGVHKTYFDNFASAIGGDGLIMSLLASFNPVGVILSGLFFGYLKTGAQIMQQNTSITRDFASLIQAIIIMLISSRLLASYINKRQLKKEVKNLVRPDL